MGSRTPPRSKLSLDEPSEDDTFGRPTSLDDGASRRLLERIAGALQVPRAALYELPDAASSVQGLVDGGTTVAGLERECTALLRTYQRIQDPEERRRLLALVQEAAERA